MYQILSLLFFISSFSAWATPSCLTDRSCFEFQGQIIDLRSSAGKALDSIKTCDPLIENCLEVYSKAPTPTLSAQEFSRLVGYKGNEYFIPITKSDVYLLAGTLSLGTIVFANDRELMDFVQDNKNEHTSKIATVGNMLGSDAIAPIAAGSYFIGAVMKNDKLKKIGIFTVRTALANQIVTELFKRSFGRKRPNESEDPYQFFDDGSHSFYSGHTSAAFSLATVIAEVYKDKPLVPYLAYGAAALTAYARMHDQRHWATDVLFGAVAGHLVTKLIIRSWDKSDKLSSAGLNITPEYFEHENGSSSYGLRLEYRGKRKKAAMSCKNYGLSGKELFSLCLQEAYMMAQ